jgi:3',5'-cyclic AMP phosphodiesterase CpdA
MKKAFIIITSVLLALSVSAQQKKSNLRFAFMTDIHLNYKNNGNCFQGLQKALDKVRQSDVEFILLGGDLVDVDGMGKNYNRADSLYGALKATLDKSPVKIYPAIGNHDRYFDEEKGYKEGDELFRKYFKESYYTFEKSGVRFFILNSVQTGDEKGYYIGKQQMEWLKNSLKDIPSDIPVVVVTHVPVYSIYYPVVENRYVFLDIIANYKELLKAFENHSLKLVLQGHQHLYEEIYSQNVQYITGGAISAGWWQGPFHGTEEGFLIVDMDNKCSWDYVDYGW